MIPYDNECPLCKALREAWAKAEDDIRRKEREKELPVPPQKPSAKRCPTCGQLGEE